MSVLCVVWSNERISDFSGKNYPEDVVNQAHIKARQLNVEPVFIRRREPHVAGLILGLILILGGEMIGRVLFYGLHMTVGMAIAG